MALSDYERVITRNLLENDVFFNEDDSKLSEVKEFAKIISYSVKNKKTNNDQCNGFQPMFHNPTKLIEITDNAIDVNRPINLARPKNGEVRRFMLEYLHGIFTKQVAIHKCNFEEIGWNKKKLFEITNKMPDNEKKIPLYDNKFKSRYSIIEDHLLNLGLLSSPQVAMNFMEFSDQLASNLNTEMREFRNRLISCQNMEELQYFLDTIDFAEEQRESINQLLFTHRDIGSAFTIPQNIHRRLQDSPRAESPDSNTISNTRSNTRTTRPENYLLGPRNSLTIVRPRLNGRYR